MYNQFLIKSQIIKSQNKFNSKLFGILIFSIFILNIEACDSHKLAPELAPVVGPARKVVGPLRPRARAFRSVEELKSSDKVFLSVLSDMPVATTSTSLPARFEDFDFRGLPTIGSECAERVSNAELQAHNTRLLAENRKLLADNYRLRRTVAKKTIDIALLSEAGTAKLNVQLRKINSELAKARNAHMAEISKLARIIAALEVEKVRLV